MGTVSLLIIPIKLHKHILHRDTLESTQSLRPRWERYFTSVHNVQFTSRDPS